MSEPRWWIVLARVAVLVSSVAMMLPGAWEHSATVVEFAQLPAGLSAWQGRSLGIYRVCGPASKFIHALPAYLAGIRVDYPASYDSNVDYRWEWTLGRLFQAQNRSQYHDIYRWSRLLPILITIVGGCLVCEWATRLFGPWPGVGSLCLWCWSPPILAHGSLVTSDMPAAVALLLSARLTWAFLLAPRLPNALLAGMALGLASATKFTLLVLYPYWGILLIARAIQLRKSGSDRDPSPSNPSMRLLGLGLLSLVTSVVVIDAFYLFQGVGFQLSDWQPGRSSLAREVGRFGWRHRMSWLLHIPLPIPIELLRGLDTQLADTERLQEGYLLGDTRLGGWWYWYVAAALFKLPLPFLAISFASLSRLMSVPQGDRPTTWAASCTLGVALEVALVIANSTGTGTNATFRYLLPSVALGCVWAGSLWATNRALTRRLGVALLACLAIDSAAAVPDHLGWQNQLGRLRGDDRPALLGDNLDWGQDLARLSSWASAHAQEGPTLVCAYGLGDFEPYGLTPLVASSTSSNRDHTTYIAVSAQVLFGSVDQRQCVGVGGNDSSIDEKLREAMLRIRPFDRVGRSILVFRASDLGRFVGLVDPPDTYETRNLP